MDETREDEAFQARVEAYWKALDDLGLPPGGGPRWPELWRWLEDWLYLLMVDPGEHQAGLLS
jgi:hypothetical protein